MNQSTLDLVNGVVAQDEATLSAHKELQTLATQGWQTDQEAIAKAVAEATAPLNEQITTLTTTVSTLQAEIDAVKGALN